MRDLLRTHQQPKAGQAQHTLKVREHPKDGPYVQGVFLFFLFLIYVLSLVCLKSLESEKLKVNIFLDPTKLLIYTFLLSFSSEFQLK